MSLKVLSDGKVPSEIHDNAMAHTRRTLNHSSLYIYTYPDIYPYMSAELTAPGALCEILCFDDKRDKKWHNVLNKICSTIVNKFSNTDKIMKLILENISKF